MRGRWMLGALALAAAIVGLLMPIHPSPEQIFLPLLMDLVHIPLFGGLTLALAWGTKDWYKNGWKALGVATFFCVALVFITEWVQPAFGRSRSSEDAVNGLLGISAAWLVCFLPMVRTGSKWRQGIWLGAAALLGCWLIGALMPIYRQSGAFAWQGAHFPDLADFTSPAQFYLWQSQPVDMERPPNYRGSHRRPAPVNDWEQLNWQAPAGEEPGALAVAIQPGQDFTGVSMALRGRARDWSGYTKLILEITNSADSARTLGIRIDDDGDVSRLKGRYQSALDLHPGVNRLELPLAAVQAGPRGRSLNMRSIRRLALFTGQADPLPHQFAITSVRLR